MIIRPFQDKIKFENAILDFLTRLLIDFRNLYNIELENYELDHICWRSTSDDDYRLLESYLLGYGKLYHKNIHNGRPISLILLNDPVVYENRIIELIELPSPKMGTPYETGFEHAEFVIDTPIDEFVIKHQDLPWDTRNIGRPINPDVKLPVGKSKVKFHTSTLAHVVKNLE